MDKKDNQKNNEQKILNDLDFDAKKTKDLEKQLKDNKHNKKYKDDEIKKLKAENAELINSLKRAKADFINYQNRTIKEKSNIKTDAIVNVVSAFLTVLDDINASKDAGDLEGPFLAIAKKIETVLANFGVQKIGSEGEIFNPEFHEALVLQPKTTKNDQKKTEIIDKVMQYGYKINDRIIRPARVIVTHK
jgi:molecular chaperone GrpE